MRAFLRVSEWRTTDESSETDCRGVARCGAPGCDRGAHVAACTGPCRGGTRAGRIDDRAVALPSCAPQFDGSEGGGRVLPEGVRQVGDQDDAERLRGGEDR